MSWKSFFLTIAHAALGGFASGLALWQFGTPLKPILVAAGVSALTSVASAISPSPYGWGHPTSQAPTNGSAAPGWKPKP